MLVPYRRGQKLRKDSSNIAVTFMIILLFYGSSTRLVAQGGGASGSGQQGQNNQATTNQEKQSSGRTVSRIDESQLVGLPLNGRSYNQLATLEAGVSDTSSQSASRGLGSGSLNVSGGRGTSNVFLLDGTNVMEMNNQSPRSAAGVQLGSDSVLQVQVFGLNYSAEYGRGSGGVLNSITRSGSPEFHGSLFEYFRNSQLDARNYFDPGGDPPPFKRNQFGFTLTGPILKGRTFFMLSFEALRDRLTETDVSAFPDREARTGRITDCAGNILVDLNKVAGSNKEVGVNSAVKPYLALYPIPNFECLGGGIGENRETFFQPSDDEFAVLRLDHQISLHDSMFIRYTFDDARSTGGGNTFLFQSRQNSRQQYLTLVETHIFSASAINSSRFGYTRPVDDSANVSAITIPREMFFIPDAPDYGQITIPRVSAFGNSSGGPSATVFNTFQFADDVVVQRRTHTIKFGTQIHRYRADAFTNSNRAGVWSFNSLESFLRGGPEGTTLTGVLPGSDNSREWRQTVLGLYLNDSYTVRANLRLDLGLRYEFATLIHDKHGKSIFVADPLRDTGPSIGPPLDHNPTHNFSPRLGISWSPGNSRNTTVRAGFGIYYDPLLPYVIMNQKGTAPFYKKTVRTNFNASGKDGNGNPLPYAFPDAVATLKDMPLQSQVMDYHNFTTSMAIRYDLEVQKDLPGGWSSRFSYAGNRGNHLYRRYEYNLYPFPQILSDGTLFFPPDCAQLPKDTSLSEFALCRPNASLGMNPAFAGGLNFLTSDVQSFYNSFRFVANKRFRSGTTLQGSYTLAKSVDDGAPGGSDTGGSGGQYPHIRTLDRALSDFDSRQQLTLNYFYPFPFGRGRQWLSSGPLSNLFGGWRLGGIVRFRTGTPFTPGMNVRKTGYLFEATRPNVAPGQSNNPAVQGTTAGCGSIAAGSIIAAGEQLGTPKRYFDPCIYTYPESGTIGNAGRNTITAPRLITTDVSLQREFPLGGDRSLQFRMEIFNLFNHTNFSGPTGGSNSAVFSGIPGRYNLSVGRLTRTSTTSRQVQFALRLSF